VLLAELPLDPGEGLGRSPLGASTGERALEADDGPGDVAPEARERGAPRMGVEIVARFEHVSIRGLGLDIATDLEAGVSEDAPGTAVVRIDGDRAGGLLRRVVEFVARVQRVREMTSGARLVGSEGDGSTQCTLGQLEPDRIRGDPELLHVGVTQAVVGPGIGRTLPESLLVAGDRAVGLAVAPGRANRGQGDQAQGHEHQAGESDGARRSERDQSRHVRGSVRARPGLPRHDARGSRPGRSGQGMGTPQGFTPG
jgi:hypothetical protein